MLHRVKIAMGGTRVLKYRCLGGGGWGEIHSSRWHARFWLLTYSTRVLTASWWLQSLSTVYNIYVESMLYLG